MAILVLLVLMLSIIGGSDATWCVCRSDADIAVIQKTLDYACGAGADCLPIHQKGACYDPDTVVSHCSYAANSFFQKSGQESGSCDFSGTATITTTDPSYGSCTYPSSVSDAGPNTTSTTPTSTTTPPFSTTPTTTIPNNFTPTTDGGLGGGIGPSGITGITTDGSGTANDLKEGTRSHVFFLAAIVFSFIVQL